MCRNFAQELAPSISAASYSSWGMLWRAPVATTELSGQPRQEQVHGAEVAVEHVLPDGRHDDRRDDHREDVHGPVEAPEPEALRVQEQGDGDAEDEVDPDVRQRPPEVVDDESEG